MLISTALFAMILKLMPSTPITWREVWIDAVVTVILFEIGKLLIGLYLGKSGVTESFLTAGSLAARLGPLRGAYLLGRAAFTGVYAGGCRRTREGSCGQRFGRKT